MARTSYPLLKVPPSKLLINCENPPKSRINFLVGGISVSNEWEEEKTNCQWTKEAFVIIANNAMDAGQWV